MLLGVSQQYEWSGGVSLRVKNELLPVCLRRCSLLTQAGGNVFANFVPVDEAGMPEAVA